LQLRRRNEGRKKRVERSAVAHSDFPLVYAYNVRKEGGVKRGHLPTKRLSSTRREKKREKLSTQHPSLLGFPRQTPIPQRKGKLKKTAFLLHTTDPPPGKKEGQDRSYSIRHRTMWATRRGKKKGNFWSIMPKLAVSMGGGGRKKGRKRKE